MEATSRTKIFFSRRRRWVFSGLGATALLLAFALGSGGPIASSQVEGDPQLHAESCTGTSVIVMEPGLTRQEREFTLGFAENGHSGQCVSTLPISGTKSHEMTAKGKGDCESAIIWITDRIVWQTDDQSERTSLIEFVSTFQIAGDVMVEKSVGRITEGELKGHIIENNTVGKVDPKLCDTAKGITEVALTGMYNTNLG